MTSGPPPSERLLEGAPTAGGLAELEEIHAILLAAGDDGEQVVLAELRAGEYLAASEGVLVSEISEMLGERLVPAASMLNETGERGARAFSSYISDVSAIHARADGLRTRAEERIGEIRSSQAVVEEICAEIGAPPGFRWDDPPGSEVPYPSSGSSQFGCAVPFVPADEFGWPRIERDRRWRKASESWSRALLDLELVQAQWRALVRERETSEKRLRDALARTPIAELAALARHDGRSFEIAVTASLSAEAPHTSHPLLRELLDVEDGSGVWEAPPDPDLVAARWGALPAWERDALIQEVPWVIGNLPGICFDDRDRANRRMLEYYIAHQGSMSAASKRALGDVMSVIARDERGPRVSIVSLSLGDRIPLVSIGYGELDTAEYLSWSVPGMLNDADRAVLPWDEAMRSQYAEQAHELEELHRDDERPALIAFLSYDTPNLVTVLGPESARDGAVRLASELDGSYATRQANTPTAARGALGHSYGTTTLVDAAILVAHPLDYVILVASAGIDGGRVSSFDELNVFTDAEGVPRVYTTLASSDDLAPFGAAASLRLQPNPGAPLPWRGIGGGYFFSSDGLGALKATEGHGIVNARGAGYLDRRTQSSASIAAIAVGELDDVTGGLARVPEWGGAWGDLPSLQPYEMGVRR